MRIRLFSFLLVAAALAIGISSCKKTTLQIEQGLESELLSKYIAKYHSTVTPKSSGLYFIETKAPSAGADSIKVGDMVKVYYRGYLIQKNDTVGIKDGYEFDASGLFEPFSFTVGAGKVIKGWDEAMLYMKDGSEAKLVIPSRLAYSGQSQASIPAYSPLVFYITIVKVYRGTDVWPVIQMRPNVPFTR